MIVKMKRLNPILSIIIPHYKEPQEMLDNVLKSIDLQRGFDKNDIEVIVVDDANYKTVNKRKDIKYITAKADCGCGIARQTGIAKSKGDYFMFVDADDQLYNSLAILNILNATAKSHDIIYGQFLQETKTADNKIIYLKMENKDTWMHGKAYNRKYIDSIGVTFPKGIKLSEDAGWNLEALNKTKNIKKIPDYILVWNNNPNSIVRKNQFASKRRNMLDYIRVIHRTSERLKGNDALGVVVVSTIYYMYFVMQQQFWKGDVELKAECEKLIAKYYLDFYEWFGSIAEEDMALHYNSRREAISSEDLYFREQEPFEKFIERICKLV